MLSDEATPSGPASVERAPGPVLARLSRPRSADPVTLAVIADPHVAVGTQGTWKVYHRTRERFRTAIGTATAHADHVLLAGDLTRDGHPAEFNAVEAVLATAGVHWSVIPGNHDVPKADDDHDTPPVSAFTDRYNDVPYTRELGECTLVAVDSASAAGRLRDTWGGEVGPSTLAWLDDALADASTPILALHHNLGRLPECEGGSDRWRNFRADDADAVVRRCREHDVSLVISGHHHVPALVGHDGPVEVIAPAVCSFPQASLHVEIGPRGTTLRLVPLADRAGIRESYTLARNGEPLGQGICALVESRIDHLPLSV